MSSNSKGIVSGPMEFRGELTLCVSNASRIAEVCQFAKSELGFDYLVDLTTIDNETRRRAGRRCIIFTARTFSTFAS
ncbi:MAG: hypothetical protein CM1200mP29_01770 [Verrucomicrobiota bacterium]|nr:MAG: hypothetical protein CM1200mP29_01770 [Verrucomicrobiota bacterium]